MNTCDIILPTYNGSKKLGYVLPALMAQDIPHGWSVRILFVDDGSTEDEVLDRAERLGLTFVGVKETENGVALTLRKGQEERKLRVRSYVLKLVDREDLKDLLDDSTEDPEPAGGK